MNCYLLTIVLIILIKTTIANYYNAHQLTDATYNDIIISNMSCTKIYYCGSYSTSNDCFSYCYDLFNNGNDYVNFCYAIDYKNPFKNNNCGKATKAHLNYYNNNCYTTAYSSKIINKAAPRRGSGLKIINGRCLTGAGWCPCNKPISSTNKCGKINNTIYECKKGYCCSKYGYCGKTKDYCSIKNGCQNSFGGCWQNQ